MFDLKSDSGIQLNFWLNICVFYVTLLATSALCVVLNFYHNRRPRLRKSQRPGLPLPEQELSLGSPADARDRRVPYSHSPETLEYKTQANTSLGKVCEEQKKTQDLLKYKFDKGNMGNQLQNLKATDLTSNSGHSKTTMKSEQFVRVVVSEITNKDNVTTSFVQVMSDQSEQPQTSNTDPGLCNKNDFEYTDNNAGAICEDLRHSKSDKDQYPMEDFISDKPISEDWKTEVENITVNSSKTLLKTESKSIDQAEVPDRNSLSSDRHNMTEIQVLATNIQPFDKHNSYIDAQCKFYNSDEILMAQSGHHIKMKQFRQDSNVFEGNKHKIPITQSLPMRTFQCKNKSVVSHKNSVVYEKELSNIMLETDPKLLRLDDTVKEEVFMFIDLPVVTNFSEKTEDEYITVESNLGVSISPTEMTVTVPSVQKNNDASFTIISKEVSKTHSSVQNKFENAINIHSNKEGIDKEKISDVMAYKEIDALNSNESETTGNILKLSATVSNLHNSNLNIVPHSKFSKSIITQNEVDQIDANVLVIESNDMISKPDEIKAFELTNFANKSDNLKEQSQTCTMPKQIGDFFQSSKINFTNKAPIREVIHSKIMQDMIVFQTAASHLTAMTNILSTPSSSNKTYSEMKHIIDEALDVAGLTVNSTPITPITESKRHTVDSEANKDTLSFGSKSSISDISNPRAQQPESNSGKQSSDNSIHLETILQKKIEKTILDDLLNMDENISESDPGTANKIINSTVQTSEVMSITSDESRFYITNDYSECTQTEKSDDENFLKYVSHSCQSILQKELKNSIENFEKNVIELNQHYERNSSNNFIKNSTQHGSKSDIMEVLSKLTEKEEKENPIIPFKLNLSNNSEIMREPRKIAESEPNVAKNILKIQQPSQDSYTEDRYGLNTAKNNSSSYIKLHSGFSTESLEKGPPTKEKIKMLRFIDDEPDEDSSVPSLINNPLKKTIFGETSSILDHKKKDRVIPSYLKDVSDGIKAIMCDLVKPLINIRPPKDASNKQTFDPTNKLIPKVSTCSTEIQASIDVPSQIDILTVQDKSTHHELSKTNVTFEINTNINPDSGGKPCTSKISEFNYGSYPTPIIRFDPINPLNNIFIPTPEFFAVHQCNPGNQSNVKCLRKQDPRHLSDSKPADDNGANSSIQCRMENVIPRYPNLTDLDNKKATKDKLNHSAQMKFEGTTSSTKHVQTNTDVVMIDNDTLLKCNPSLTNVSSSQERLSSCETSDDYRSSSNNTTVKSSDCDSNFEIIYTQKVLKNSSSIFDGSDCVKPMRRKRKKVAATEKVILDHNKKARALSYANRHKDCLKLFEEYDRTKVVKNAKKSVLPQLPPKNFKRERNISNRNSPSPRKTGDVIVNFQYGDRIKKHGTKCANGPHDESRNTPSSLQFNGLNIPASEPECTNGYDLPKPSVNEEWGMLMDDSSSKNIMAQCVSSTRVMETIDLLPFMGSDECRRDFYDSTDWSFLLLYGKVRMSICLGEIPQRLSADALVVTADTPIQRINIESTVKDIQSPIGVLSVRFALDTMKHFAKNCTRAGELPMLLRHSTATARIVLNWGTAMYDLYLRMAFTLTAEGHLTFKVMNLPLMSIYEVSLDIILPLDSLYASGPQATNVSVTTLVHKNGTHAIDLKPTLDSIDRDWRHVPRTLWQVHCLLRNQGSSETNLLERLHSSGPHGQVTPLVGS